MEIKFFTSKKKFKKGGSDIKPDFFWRCIVSGTTILILASMTFGFYFFTQTNSKSVLLDIDARQEEIVKEKRLDQVLNYFLERENKSSRILNSSVSVVDPSL